MNNKKYNTFAACEQPALKDWTNTVAEAFPHLSWAQVWGLALLSFGMILAHTCGLTTVADYLAKLLDRSSQNLQAQLEEVCYEAEAKRGKKRQAIAVNSCFKPLLQWVLRWWQPNDKHLVLAIDASNLGQHFTLLAISVVYRGCALPVAWKITRGSEPGAWKPYWLALLQALEGAIPADWQVLVVADRGLYARWLFQEIVRLKWHPLLRLNEQGYFQVKGQTLWRPLWSAAPRPGTCWGGEVLCFKDETAQVEGTLLASWGKQYAEAWILLTDLPYQEAQSRWYGMRSWIEDAFKDAKKGGWQWQQTRMQLAGRAERMWLGIALANIWVLSEGGLAEVQEGRQGQVEEEEWVKDLLPSQDRAVKKAGTTRWLSIFRQGISTIIIKLIKGSRMRGGQFIPEKWGEDAPLEGQLLLEGDDLSQLIKPIKPAKNNVYYKKKRSKKKKACTYIEKALL